MDENEHSKVILPVCIEIFKRLEDKVDTLLDKTDKLNEKFIEINELKEKVKLHEAKFVGLETNHKFVIGILSSIVVAILIQIGTFLYFWGDLNRQVNMDSRRIETIEEIHPRLSQ